MLNCSEIDAYESENALKILSFIVSHDGPVTYTSVIRFAAENGIFCSLRRMERLFDVLISEHNGQFL